MAEICRFFDSIDGTDDRFYTADEFAEYFRQFIRNGIFGGSGDNLKVGTDGQNMQTFIRPGYAWIEGYLYKIDTEPLVLEHTAAGPGNDRIDRVVIRLDKTLEHRYVRAFILEGEPGAEPMAPALTRNENVFEIALAQVLIEAGKSYIEAYQITDKRLDPLVCGVVTHLFDQVDTTELFDEWMLYLTTRRIQGDNELASWQDYLAGKRHDTNSQYEHFISILQSRLVTYQNAWNSWVDDKLMSPTGEFYTEWKNWLEEIQDITNLVTRSDFTSHVNHTIRDDAHGLRLNGNYLEAEDQYGRWRKVSAPAAINTWGGM